MDQDRRSAVIVIRIGIGRLIIVSVSIKMSTVQQQLEKKWSKKCIFVCCMFTFLSAGTGSEGSPRRNVGSLASSAGAFFLA